MLKIKYLKNEKGVALITSIMLLSLLTIIGFSSMNSSDIELKISGNERASTQAFVLAEAGIDHTIAKLQIEPDVVVTRDFSSLADYNYDDVSDEPYLEDVPLGNGLYNVSLKYINDNEIKLRSTGGFAGSSSVIEVVLEIDSSSVPYEVFGYGIITDGDLRINGAPNIIAPLIHANGDIVQNGAGIITANVSSVGSVSVGSTVIGDTTPSADRIDVPDPWDQKYPDDPLDNRTHFDIYREAAIGGPDYYDGNTTITLTGDQGGKIIFVNGNIQISGSFKNASVIATGNIDLRGSSELGGVDDDLVQVALISGGDIEFNGSNDSYGVFWSSGSFVQNGSSMVHGSIASSGVIRRNGEFNFTYNGNIDNGNVTDPNAPLDIKTTSWADMSFISI